MRIFPCGSAGKESACNVGDLSLIPGLERYPGEGKGYPLQYSGLGNSMDCLEHGVAKSDKTDQTFTFTKDVIKPWLYCLCCDMTFLYFVFLYTH